ncbi:MAG TPA: hypothetical protein VEN31_10660 [Candidatus Bathyarchaeia archaeon]|nr:hypothetical protein [Candidatus Bathyarchaeia archaeon]
MRRLVPLIASLTLLAPSCPRDYGPSNYDSDATGSFAPSPNADDLVYVSGGSAKGDSDFVVAMPPGEILIRIDGPDRRGWVFASPTLAYYPMFRASANPSITIHRIDLRTGSRARIITDDRPGLPLLDEAGRFDTGDPGSTALALTADKAGLFVARLLSAGPRVWIGRYDALSGKLQAERSWPITATAAAANARLGVGRDRLVVVTSARTDAGSVVQEMRFLDASLAEVAALDTSDLPADERCSAALQALDGMRWATVCGQPEGRHASFLIFDGAYRIASRIPVKLEVRERVIAWTAQGGAVAMLTDRARYVRVVGEADPTSTWLAEPDGRTAVRVAREIAPGIFVAELVTNSAAGSGGETAVLELATGRVLARAAGPAIALDFAGAGDRLYALLPGAEGLGPRLQRFDRESLAPVGGAAALPQRDDVIVGGLIAVIPAR